MTGALVHLADGGGGVDDVGRDRVDPDVDAREPRTRACTRRRAAADPRARVRAPRVREGRALLRHGRRARSRSTGDYRADVDAAAAARSDRRPRSSSRRRSTTRTASWTRSRTSPRSPRRTASGCHVDACIGGFVLPFLERLGVDVPPWDFRVDGVTEISADIHKYGYAPKGASVVLHRDADWFGHQVFLYDHWPSGLYGSPGVAGARSAAPIATAWAVLRHLGVRGLRRDHPRPRRDHRRRAGRDRAIAELGRRRRPDRPGAGDARPTRWSTSTRSAT